MSIAIVTIYSRPGCHLCDEAKANILSARAELDFDVEEVDIDSDPDLRERYGYDIPVVFINGIKVFKHRVDTGEFRRKLLRIAFRQD